jgi:hypothetical protein
VISISPYCQHKTEIDKNKNPHLQFDNTTATEIQFRITSDDEKSSFVMILSAKRLILFIFSFCEPIFIDAAFT